MLSWADTGTDAKVPETEQGRADLLGRSQPPPAVQAAVQGNTVGMDSVSESVKQSVCWSRLLSVSVLSARLQGKTSEAGTRWESLDR